MVLEFIVFDKLLQFCKIIRFSSRDDQRLIDEITETALLQKPAFICIVGSQIPALIGCDLPAIARIVERNTGIRSFSLPTNSMHYYARGVCLALEAMADLMVENPPQGSKASGKRRTVNILGLTPLDFSTNGSDESICRWLSESGYSVLSRWAMGSSLAELQRAAHADVNLVVTYGGMGAARMMEKKWGIPYVVGVPFGNMKKRLLPLLESSDGKPSSCAYLSTGEKDPISKQDTILVGESIFSCSLAQALEEMHHRRIRVLCPVETEDNLLRPQDMRATDETELAPIFSSASAVIADPLYKPICADAKFIELPHEGFSGRLYRKYIPNLVDSLEKLDL